MCFIIISFIIMYYDNFTCSKVSKVWDICLKQYSIIEDIFIIYF